MTEYRVLQYPNAELRTTARAVTVFGTPALDALIEDMIRIMRVHHGIGLAATQIGVHEQIAVIALKDGPLVLINPVLTNVATTHEQEEEGCLSVRSVFGTVPRAVFLTLRAQRQDGSSYTTHAAGLFARVVQHEYDHLQGKLFIDRCARLTSGKEQARKLGIEIG